MEAAAQAEFFQFPVMAAAPVRSIRHQMREAVEKHGPLFPQGFIPLVLDLSRQRVAQLIDNGHLATVSLGGKTWVPMAALDLFLSEERKAGRPTRELTLREGFRRGFSGRK